MDKNNKILVAGANGLVGKALVDCLISNGYNNLLTPSRSELNYMIQTEVLDYFVKHQPEYVFVAAAKVGGILANSFKSAEFIYQNLMIQSNIIHMSMVTNVKKLLFLGSSCIYPKYAEQPISESELLNGYLEETNKPYAVAKIAGITMCQAYRKQYGLNAICVMPSNLYGPNDNFDLKDGHVLPALLRRFVEANPNKPITLWGDGTPRREFLYVYDLADALIYLMNNYEDGDLINVGYGSDITISELAHEIQKITKHNGAIRWDTTKPNGTPKKLLDSSKVFELGWKPKTSLSAGLIKTYNWYLSECLNGSMLLN